VVVAAEAVDPKTAYAVLLHASCHRLSALPSLEGVAYDWVDGVGVDEAHGITLSGRARLSSGGCGGLGCSCVGNGGCG
jgi:hypothetical protein